MSITKPMLAGKCTDINALRYPVLCTPKLDGIRCMKVGGKALSRKFLPIPNPHIRETIEAHFPDGVDGELIIPGVSFSETSGAVMRHTGTPAFRFFVFDYVKTGTSLTMSYAGRMELLKDLELDKVGEYTIERVLPVRINNVAEMEAYEQKCIDEGFEGAMVRDPAGPYKLGRSSEKEGYLLKVKRFEDSEAVVLDLVEKMRNDNEATRDNVGHTKRSTSAEGMTPMNTLGALLVRDVKTGVEFSIGSGLDDATRAKVWAAKKKYIGKLVTYKHQPSGAKEKGAPRFPVFKAFRDPRDMD